MHSFSSKELHRIIHELMLSRVAPMRQRTDTLLSQSITPPVRSPSEAKGKPNTCSTKALPECRADRINVSTKIRRAEWPARRS